jgi:hypothetical protein
VVAYGAPPGEALAAASSANHAQDEPAAAPRSRHWAWADLMRRAFDIDVLACPRCGGRLRLLGTVEDPEAIQAILAALALSRGRADRAPPQDARHAAAIDG